MGAPMTVGHKQAVFHATYVRLTDRLTSLPLDGTYGRS